jgi:hypothetical protein
MRRALGIYVVNVTLAFLLPCTAHSRLATSTLILALRRERRRQPESSCRFRDDLAEKKDIARSRSCAWSHGQDFSWVGCTCAG